MKLIFAGTPEFAAVALRGLHAAGHEVTLVMTQPDRPAGRGMKLQTSAVKKTALALSLPVAQPPSLGLMGKNPKAAQEAHELLRNTPHEAMIVAAYGLILPGSILAIPVRGCINIHASLLPRWRGAAPIQRAIEAGDENTGIAIMKMDVGLDTGAVYLQKSIPIAPDDSAASLHDKLAGLGSQLIVQALEEIAAGTLHALPQAEGASYAAKIDKAEARLNWEADAELLDRKIRAFNNTPGAVFEFQGSPLKVWRTQVSEQNGVPGELLTINTQGPVIACGKGSLLLLEVQKAGGKRISGAQFLQGLVSPTHLVS